MPELPEVETVRRKFDRALTGHTLSAVEVVPDSIVWSNYSEKAAQSELQGALVTKTGRRGKYFWIELDGGRVLYGHLGMAGWVRILGEPTTRLLEHGKAPLDDESGRPRFLKLMLESDSGLKVAMTDGRRLARLWLGGPSDEEPKIQELGPDMWLHPWTPGELFERLQKRKAPMKSLLLDQSLFAGVGNWIADEVLWHSRISPLRLGADMSQEDCSNLLSHLAHILNYSVDVGADMNAYPEDWLFHTRWGGAKGPELHQGHSLVRQPIGGRTTVWVPGLQS